MSRVALLIRSRALALVCLALPLHCLLWQVSSAEETQAQHLKRIADNAGENSSEMLQALKLIPQDQKPGLVFLLENMPVDDLKSLKASFLIEHIELAYKAKREASWGEQIPDAIFLNNVLPYANVNEKRDDVRKDLRQQFWPIVKDMPSISVAAATLNREVFRKLNVKYSTKRRRADQGPAETMESGLASCTGLSILLIDACRACGIPARFVGTPMWSNKSGNHSWVEIWDSSWHYTGAAEPTGDELNKGWFTGRAAQASLDDPRHGIFAVSFKKTDLQFPMVWARRGEVRREVYAENVTARYAKPQKQIAKDLLELQFRALGSISQDRCRANVIVRGPDGSVVFRGQTYDESHDANDHLTAKLKPGKYQIELLTETGKVLKELDATSSQLVTLRPEPKNNSAVERLEEYLDEKDQEIAFEEISEQEFAQIALSKSDSQRAQELLVNAYQNFVRQSRRSEHKGKRIILGDKEMRYDYRVFGEEPEKGHSLYISMHGGGGAPARVNDQQWKNQIRLYELEEGIYVAPRAPTDTWNLWHQGHIDPMFTRLIANFIVFEGVDPDRVYITGYSAGGDGVFQLAPRMADQLAAAAMMAGHPNETKPDGLLNLPFTLHMGEKDGAYQRNQKAKQWKSWLKELSAKHEGKYKHWVKLHAGKGHWMGGQDIEGVRWMSQFTRNSNPKHVVWLQDDVVHDRFYWLAVPEGKAKARTRIEAKIDGQKINIVESTANEFELLLRDGLLNLDDEIVVTMSGSTILSGQPFRTIATLTKTLIDRGDPRAMYSASIPVELTETRSAPE